MSFFEDTESVFINNKEVQSIILSGGGVIYNKPSSQPVETGNITVYLQCGNMPPDFDFSQIQVVVTGNNQRFIFPYNEFSDRGGWDLEVSLNNKSVGMYTAEVDLSAFEDFTPEPDSVLSINGELYNSSSMALALFVNGGYYDEEPEEEE